MGGHNYELIRFPNADTLARAVAVEWLGQLQQRDANIDYAVALPGGRIARKLFEIVADLAKPRPGLLQTVDFFWGDERCVPPGDPESNFALANEILLRPLGIHPDKIHRIRGEAPPQIAASDASEELRRWARSESGGQPVLDLILLGMGEDGHTASLFPNEPETLVAGETVFRAVVAAKPPPRRITLGYQTIIAARRVWVLASGAGKESALSDSLAPGDRTPLGRVLSRRSGTKVFSDIVLQSQ